MDAARIPIPANFPNDLLVNFILFPFYLEKSIAGGTQTAKTAKTSMKHRILEVFAV